MIPSKSLEYYRNIASNGKQTISLTQDEAAVVLKVHDWGLEVLNDEEQQLAHQVFAKLKQEIWP